MDSFLKIVTSEQAEPWLDLSLLTIMLLYMIFAWLQWFAIRRQSTIAYQAMKVANDANQMAKQTLVITQRARISITGVSIGQVSPNPPVLTCKLANAGEESAIGVLTYTMWSEDHPSRVHDSIRQQIGEESGDTGYVIDPHSEEHLSIELTKVANILDKAAFLSPVEWQNIFGGGFKRHIGICVEYFDGFGNACLTETWHLYDPLTKEWYRTYMRQS